MTPAPTPTLRARRAPTHPLAEARLRTAGPSIVTRAGLFALALAAAGPLCALPARNAHAAPPLESGVRARLELACNAAGAPFPLAAVLGNTPPGTTRAAVRGALRTALPAATLTDLSASAPGVLADALVTTRLLETTGRAAPLVGADPRTAFARLLDDPAAAATLRLTGVETAHERAWLVFAGPAEDAPLVASAHAAEVPLDEDRFAATRATRLRSALAASGCGCAPSHLLLEPAPRAPGPRLASGTVRCAGGLVTRVEYDPARDTLRTVRVR